MSDRELELTEDGTKDLAVVADELMDAIDLASNQNETTWLTVTNGESKPRRVAAIVPADRVADICLRHLKPYVQNGLFHMDGSPCRT